MEREEDFNGVELVMFIFPFPYPFPQGLRDSVNNEIGKCD